MPTRKLIRGEYLVAGMSGTTPALTKLTNREAVEQAMVEYDRLGRAAFLEKHGFRRARDYYIDHKDRYCDSKAIAEVAYGIEHPIVVECRGDRPKLQVINDPWSLFKQDVLSLVPRMYRLART
jgi:hypothetical protein